MFVFDTPATDVSHETSIVYVYTRHRFLEADSDGEQKVTFGLRLSHTIQCCKHQPSSKHIFLAAAWMMVWSHEAPVWTMRFAASGKCVKEKQL